MLRTADLIRNQVIDYAIWTLLNKKYKEHYRPPHMLCHGMSKTSSTWQNGAMTTSNRIPGVVCNFANEHVESLRGVPWRRVFGLLGKAGGKIMLTLLMDCGLFVPLDKQAGTYYQLSGER